MTAAGIYFDHVWKKFRRGNSNVDVMTDAIANFVKRTVRGPEHLEKAEFWAVRDVSFHVRPGEALGIIGPNGAGKSTILKLLTRILRPTQGHCQLRGRVGSLIEIGAGFHPDLTGRENVFLQGAIVGMKRREIRERFDAIVDFSGISEFIDTPVRRYSSGMNARLGFSIAAHLDPDVLIIDEVLAVGDFGFQQRAFGRIQDIVNGNVACVLVSHQLERVATLCHRAILLNRGEVAFEGTSADTIAAYVMDDSDLEEVNADAPIALDELRVIDDVRVQPGARITCRVAARVIDASRLRQEPEIAIHLRSLQTGQLLFRTSSARLGIVLPQGNVPFELEVTLAMNVEPGVYQIEAAYFDRSRTRGKKRAKGPRATITVEPDPAFVGRVYASPTMQLVTSEARLTAAGAIR
jgi:ABC-type polysaccharide/polyol phosphate transport system ATPase subunit